MKYDYIIAGAGCAGLSLLYKILQDPQLREKRILLVDKATKTSNDRTWCFWERESGPFESIVRHQWEKLIFKTETFENKFSLEDYKYKMIKGIDFYNFTLTNARKFTNVAFCSEEIIEFEIENDDAILITEDSRYTANYIFNSTGILNPDINKKNSLLQHFMGWEISTDENVFDRQVGTLMDFSIDQKHGTTFMYVLPITKKLALIEYTLFTESILDKNDYENAIRNYIKDNITTKKYEVVHKEFGIIPMSLKKFPQHYQEKVINMGTAGGYTKASSGYTFQFIQKHTDKIISRLRKGKSPLIRHTAREKMFQWYDRTLLDVIISNKMTAKEIFSTLFKKLPPEKILKFLGNESNFSEDLNVMLSVPTLKFLRSGLKQL